MPQEKLKVDNYENFGGVNRKASVYLTGPREMLELFNFDSSVVGDLTGRPGSTQYFSATFANTGIIGLAEYTKLNGYSKIMVAHPGGMWLGSDNTVTGISLGSLATAQTYIWQLAVSPSQMNFQTINFASFSSQYWDYQTFVDHQFFCDGLSYLKFNGTTQTFAGLPDVIFDQEKNSAIEETMGFTTALAGTGATYGVYYYFAFAYINERGFLGPPRINPRSITTGTTNQRSYIHVTFPLTGFGITAMAVYSYVSSTLISQWETHFNYNPIDPVAGSNAGILRLAPDERFRLLTILPLGSTLYYSNFPYSSSGEIPKIYEPFGQTNMVMGVGTSNQIVIQERVANPKAIELYKDILFWFTNNSSSLYFSDPDFPEPEGWNPEWELEFRTNDGDKLTAAKAYGNRLMVGKGQSLHEVTGDDAETFVKREISVEYGILNNRACTTWQGRFWFLDRKGICEYVGGIPKIVSDDIEDVFERMNLSVAIETAQMVYMKNRDEIWTIIPVDGATKNNLIVIYSINTQKFYFWDGPNISILAKMIGRFGKETSFFGDYSNRINTFGSSFMGDNGAGFTSLVKFRYEQPRGRSVESFYRRLFVNADNLAGFATTVLDYKLRADYGSSYQVSGTMVLSDFQKVVNFGVPAKSLSVELSNFSATYSIRLHGYAMESRWIRNT